MKNKTFLLLACVASAGFISACSPVTAKRGNMLQDFQMEQITPGVSSRSNVLKVFGSPTAKDPFHDDIWYYIGQETKKHGIFDPEVAEERIVIVTFNEEGIVEAVSELDEARVDVPLAGDKTPTHGNDLSVMQQFMGNLGRFNPQSAEE